MKVHGVELGGDGRPAWLHFGFVRLLQHLAESNLIETPTPEWAARFHSPGFTHRMNHFHQCFRKFDRAVLLVAECSGAADRWSVRTKMYKVISPPVSQPFALHCAADFRDLLDANANLPLHFDSMLFYLRIQADAYAKLVPSFYRESSAGKMPSDSFRDHYKWFTKTKADFDPDYASILAANRAWFDRLSGENPKGLRDVMVHQSGVLHFRWAQPQADSPIKPQAGLYTGKGFVEEDLYDALREMTSGWCAFLDAAWHHFVPRLRTAGVLMTMSADDGLKTRYSACLGGGLLATWAYSTVHEARA